MSETEQGETAETLFVRVPTREEIKNAIGLEDARRAATVKNLYRLRALRLSREQARMQRRNTTGQVAGP